MIKVNPNHGWANSPEIHVNIAPPSLKDIMYFRTENYYWYQVDGVTDFLYNSSPLVASDDGWVTLHTTEGFGGCEFKLNVSGYGLVTLRGAWSSGSYGANKVLPKPCVEVVYQKSRMGYLTIEKVNKLLEGTFWEVVEGKLNDKYWVHVTYKGLTKPEWPEGWSEQLDKEWKS